MQEAEFVAFWVGQDVPALGADLADVGGPGAESEQPLQLGVLVAVGGVDVDVQPELPGPRVAAGAEDEGGLRATEAGVGRPDLDASVVFPADFDVAEDLAPECGEPAGVGGVDDQLTDAACHARQCRQATREPIVSRVLAGDVLCDRVAAVPVLPGILRLQDRNRVQISGRPVAPVVVLAHEFGCGQNMWPLAVPALERHFTVVLIDHAGSGRSDLPA